MKRTLTIAIIAIFLLSLGCYTDGPSKLPTRPIGPPSKADIENMDSCAKDEDCICGGTDPYTKRCFLGNIDYYEKHVDKSTDCPDFCAGIAGNLVVKCVDSKCIQVFECIMESDCGKSSMCQQNKCVEGEQKEETPDDLECRRDSDCNTDGCSGQLCRPKSAEPIMTTCDYLPEYDCFKFTKCGCSDGKCAWEQNDEYAGCIAEKR